MTDNEQSLVTGLKALAASETAAPPPSLEAALLKRMRPKRSVPWLASWEMLAAAAVLAIAFYPRPDTSSPGVFIPVPYTEPVGPTERSEIVRINVPVLTLARWGYPVTLRDPEQRVNAEIVLGEDGLARAVRIVSTHQ